MPALSESGVNIVVSSVIAAAGVVVACVALLGVDAALATVPVEDGPPLVRAVGLADEELQRQLVLGPPDGRTPRAVRVSYHYGEHEGDARTLIYGGVAVPVTAGADGEGLLAIFTRSPSHQFRESEVRDLEELAT